ncbi:MAG: DUF2321 domain-containing protein [Candidatus Delongbacteria bacterium]|nr:DUF2321 domain-containing protein [Candidatus Delongbacteria bacterium]
MSDYYDVQQVCLNGHQINSSFQRYPKHNKDFCDECGEKTIHSCPNCNHPIKGYHRVDGVISFASTPVPKNCEKCGNPFPWTVKKNENKVKKENNKVVTKSNTEPSQDIFIVHGHNNEMKESVARLIDKQGLNPIILHEQPNKGKTIIEKFEHNSNVGFAIILLTDDDKGKPKSETRFKLRARQNVVLELGYFIGKLGRDKICPLYTKGVELPNDINGLVYIEIDPKGAWKLDLLKELKAVGYKVDANKL